MTFFFFPEWQCVFPLSFLAHTPWLWFLPSSIQPLQYCQINLPKAALWPVSHPKPFSGSPLPENQDQPKSYLFLLTCFVKVTVPTPDSLFLLHSPRCALPYIKLHVDTSHKEDVSFLNAGTELSFYFRPLLHCLVHARSP